MLWESWHVTEVSTSRVGVDVHVPGRIPRQAVPVTSTIIEPGAVVGIGDAVGGIPVGIHFREEEFNLHVGTRSTVGSRQGQEIFIEDADTALDAVDGEVALAAVGEYMDHARNSVQRHAWVVDGGWVGRAQGAVGA